ncbi:hypothetical protein P152DRAFT_402057 [Eremomyces bilateralis CBS 781.70]|uniref:RING-type domain-containing protein n=1 Tax=Eremomyces bilateralis CBS 781.70 TaxID=1392243 RepID=A0A6G1FWQ8_9PEZI|nr:uncharacterized protein P152DRAFT_402057 [Eremomyces bilateralis CBS 781.70]KAF1810121.1 hypothetical protein P152DRAFT_402057 [Eremomyces bilateralis CBS 781.70]
MTSNPPSAISTKGPSTSSPISTPQSQSSSVSAGDTAGQRRAGGSGSFGAGSSSRSSTAPRNSQGLRKQHKGSKRVNAPIDEDTMAESAAIRSATGRKGQTSITHLMTFAMPPRADYESNRHLGRPRNYRANPTWGPGSGYHAVDKARYVHSNYRFVVDPRGDYRQQNLDADVYLDWSQVLQIIVSSESQTSFCPICLDTPVAPRIAQCGHIFCLPCIIRYMHSEEESRPLPGKKPRSRQCPLCHDSIYMSDTRAVRWYTGQEGPPPREGQDVMLRLMKRRAGTALALPRDGAESISTDDDVPWHFAAEVMDYARVMKGTEEYIVQQLDFDIDALKVQEQEDELMFGEENVEWVRRAIRMIEDTKEKMKGIGNAPNVPSKPKKPRPKQVPIQYESSSEAPEMYNIQHDTSSGQSLSEGLLTSQSQSTSITETTSTSDSLFDPAGVDVKATAETKSGPRNKHQSHFRSRQDYRSQPVEYYFYQSLLHYYLTPLDIRILREAFGPYASFPATILPRVERVSTGHVIDDDLRRRFKYLAHLPHGCEVAFLECDWTDLVPPAVLAKFHPDITARRRRNLDKDAREEKARIRAEKEEDENRFPGARRKRLSASLSSEDFQPLPPSIDPESSSAVDIAGADRTPQRGWSASPPYPGRRTQGSAFAELASPSTSPNASRTVWGTPAVRGTSPSLEPWRGSEQDGLGDDGWLQGWETDLLGDEGLVGEVAALGVSEEAEGSGSGSGGASAGASAPTRSTGGGKKKKAKKITLMSTSVRRGA